MWRKNDETEVRRTGTGKEKQDMGLGVHVLWVRAHGCGLRAQGPGYHVEATTLTSSMMIQPLQLWSRPPSPHCPVPGQPPPAHIPLHKCPGALSPGQPPLPRLFIAHTCTLPWYGESCWYKTVDLTLSRLSPGDTATELAATAGLKDMDTDPLGPFGVTGSTPPPPHGSGPDPDPDPGMSGTDPDPDPGEAWPRIWIWFWIWQCSCFAPDTLACCWAGRSGTCGPSASTLLGWL